MALTALTAQEIAGAISSAARTRGADLDPVAERSVLGLGTAALLNLTSPFLKYALISGGAAGNLTVTGIKTTDSLRLALKFTGAGTSVTDLADLTSEFSITATNTINNTGGTASTGKLLVVWISPT